MKYALGNMLNGAGGLNADGLSLDLQFAADKTLTARRGPTPVFTRGTMATEIGPDGLVRYAPENILLRSQEFNLTWAVNNSMTVTADAATAPDGTLTADAINFDTNAGSRIIQFAGSNVVSTFSVWLRAAAPTTCIIATTAAGSAGDYVTASVTTEWQRFSVVATTWVTGTASFSCRIGNNVAGTTGTIFAWGAQLERSSTARTYIPTTTAAVYGPRFDHDPIGRTNLLSYSEQFDNEFWNKATATTVVANSSVSPDGLTTADTWTTTGGVYPSVFATVSATNGVAYTLSVYAKAGSLNTLGLELRGSSSNPDAIFNLSNGTVASGSGQIQNAGNGWYRCSITRTATSATMLSIIGAGGGAVLAGTLLLWGAQLEIGSTVTNYIPTTSNPVTVRDCKGLLIEESRTNLVFPSETLATQTRTVTAVAHTLSFYGTGTVVLSGAAIATVTGTGAYPTRTTLTFTPTAGSLILTVTGSVTQAQLEAGSFPTSYIPTTTAALARSADVCSITGSAFSGFYNQSEGTMLANAFTPASEDRTVLAADDNTANEMIRLRTEGTNPFFKVTDGGSDVVAIDAGTVTANTAFKLIGAYKVNDFASSINGGSAVTDTTGTIPTVDRMRIGAGQGGNTMCGCISAIRYFKKRLANAKLTQLTT
jgi:hypothetical protein